MSTFSTLIVLSIYSLRRNFLPNFIVYYNMLKNRTNRRSFRGYHLAWRLRYTNPKSLRRVWWSSISIVKPPSTNRFNDSCLNSAFIEWIMLRPRRTSTVPTIMSCSFEIITDCVTIWSVKEGVDDQQWKKEKTTTVVIQTSSTIIESKIRYLLKRKTIMMKASRKLHTDDLPILVEGSIIIASQKVRIRVYVRGL